MSLIRDAGAQISDAIIHNQKTALAVPFGTAAIGTLFDVAQVQSLLTVISMLMGIVISGVILWHKLIQVKIAHIEHREARQRLDALIRHEETKVNP